MLDAEPWERERFRAFTFRFDAENERSNLGVRMTFKNNAPSKSARIVGTVASSVAVIAMLVQGCERKPPRLVMTETTEPGMNTETAEYFNGSAHAVSRVAHFYNSPTGDRSEAGDFTTVFRAMTGKELAEPAAVRSASALLSTLEKEGVKLTAEPGGKVEESPMAPRVRAFSVAREP